MVDSLRDRATLGPINWSGFELTLVRHKAFGSKTNIISRPEHLLAEIEIWRLHSKIEYVYSAPIKLIWNVEYSRRSPICDDDIMKANKGSTMDVSSLGNDKST